MTFKRYTWLEDNLTLNEKLTFYIIRKQCEFKTYLFVYLTNLTLDGMLASYMIRGQSDIEWNVNVVHD